jgi:hypothetical protein
MNIDERLEEARRDSGAAYWKASWAASEKASRAASWAAHQASSGGASWSACRASYWASRYEDCSYKVQVEILKGLLDD